MCSQLGCGGSALLQALLQVVTGSTVNAKGMQYVCHGMKQTSEMYEAMKGAMSMSDCIRKAYANSGVCVHCSPKAA